MFRFIANCKPALVVAITVIYVVVNNMQKLILLCGTDMHTQSVIYKHAHISTNTCYFVGAVSAGLRHI